MMAERPKCSEVWLHFSKAEDKEEAKVLICSKLISCKGGNTTINITNSSSVNNLLLSNLFTK